MKLSVFCLLVVFCGTNCQFQVPDESGDVFTLLANLQAQLEEQKQQKGAVYIRWGRTTCGNAETVYSGVAGGSWFEDPGGGTNTQCLPNNPQWGPYQDGVQRYKAYMSGAEYELGTTTPFGSTSLDEDDIPCAVCYVPTRGSMLMIPARRDCYTGWTREYRGYLMASYDGYASATDFICVDEQPEAAPGGYADRNGAVFYPVEARCGSLPCPNYVEGKDLACAVCTK